MRLIDADALLFRYETQIENPTEEVSALIEKAPTAMDLEFYTMEEVDCSKEIALRYRCTKCGMRYTSQALTFYFCPRCGARLS